MSEWWNAFKEEVGARMFSSKKRLIKWIGICFVPIIYAVICIVAFWNPTENIGRAPVAILDNDKTVYVIKTSSLSNEKFQIGVIADADGVSYDADANPQEFTDNEEITTTSGNTYIFDSKNYSIEKMSTWSLMKKLFVNASESTDDQDFKFKTDKIGSKQLIFNNIHYLKGDKAKKEWKNNKYYIQVQIPENYLETIINKLGNIVQGEEDNSSIQQLKVFTTFERNFIFGYYMQTLTEFKEAIPAQIFESMISKTFNKYFGFDALKDSDSDSGTISNTSIFGANCDGTGKFVSNLASIGKLVKNSDLDKMMSSINGINIVWAAMKSTIKFITNNAVVFNRILYDYDNGKNWWEDDTRVIVTMPLGTLWSCKLKDIYSNKLILSILPYQFKKDSGFTPYNLFAKYEKMNEEEWNEALSNAATTNGFESSENMFKWMALGNLSSELIDLDIQGSDKGLYGIGLGEFFIFIGLFVGTLMQTFIFDRAKRYHKASHKQWFFSKLSMHLMIGLIQATCLSIVLYAVGWSMIGIVPMINVWLFIMFVECIFVITITGFWYLIKDETIGKFLAVIFMVLNLASGWGTFPAWMQFKFFGVISNVMEFTYALHGIGSIIYGSGTVGNNWDDISYTLIQIGILCVFGFFFLTVGYFGSKNRHKEMLYGSFIGKYVVEALNKLEMAELATKFTNDNNPKGIFRKYNWKALGTEPLLDVAKQIKQDHPFEGQYEWWKNKEHDKVLKPNFTDEEDIERKDEVEV